MGHHHKKHSEQENRNERREQRKDNINDNMNSNMNNQNNFDFSSMLSGFNFDNIDFSKIDFGKVQSMMDKIKLPENNGNGENPGPSIDPRLNLLNSLKPFLPSTRAKKIDNVSKFFQIARMFNNNKAAKS